MRLSNIYETIFENVEKLIPYLQSDVQKYLARRQEAGMPAPSEFPRYQHSQAIDKWIKTAVDWALRADPRYTREIGKGKPLDRIKAPFVKQILKWWLDPASGSGINLPEDIETVAETLNNFNIAKQHGLNAEASNFDKWSELIAALQPFITNTEASSDTYARMGFELVFSEGPWKMYLVNKWVPGGESKLYPGQVCHRAFEGTRWCVKYQSTFENTYSGIYYLVLYNGRRFGLINFPSLQFKDPNDQPIAAHNFDLGAQFLQLLFGKNKEFLAQLALSLLKSQYNNDFTPFINNEIKDEIRTILNTDSAKTAALNSGVPTQVVALAKYIGQWPKFKEWPEGRQKILTATRDISCNTQVVANLRELVQDGGRIPEVEQEIMELPPTSNKYHSFAKYCSWLQEPAPDLIPVGRQLVEKIVEDTDEEDLSPSLRNAVSWLSIERRINGTNKTAPWPEIESMILATKNAKLAYSYAKMRNAAWPEAEPLIATDERATKGYYKLTGKDLQNTTGKEDISPQDIVRKAIAMGREIPDKEDTILQDLNAAIMYAVHIIGPWPELEDELHKHGTYAQKQKYAKEVLYSEFQ